MLGHLLLLQNTGHLVALGLAAGVAPQLQMMVSNSFQQSAKAVIKLRARQQGELFIMTWELTRCLANFKARFSLPSFNNSAKER